MMRTYAGIDTITGTAQVLATPTPPLTARHLLGGVRAMSQSTPLERFMDKITAIDAGYASPCWLWQAFLNRDGYGRFVVNGRNILVHRWAYEHFNRPIPEGMTIDHLCRNRSCANPEHLEVVTRRVNILRGTGPSAHAARQTHCKYGHEFTSDNTYSRPGTSERRCRECHRVEINAKRQRDPERWREIKQASRQRVKARKQGT